MYIKDPNQYATELVTYLLVIVVYFYELIVYMLLERNTFDSIAFFSQCMQIRLVHFLVFSAKTKVISSVVSEYKVSEFSVVLSYVLFAGPS